RVAALFRCGAQHRFPPRRPRQGCTHEGSVIRRSPFAAFWAFPCRSALLGLAHLFQRAQAKAFLLAEALLGQAFDRRAAVGFA
ncbi:hypothetical protein V2B08_33810, partial [Pseudomonas aeruginosa]